jgi:hypothetical protein
MAQATAINAVTAPVIIAARRQLECAIVEFVVSIWVETLRVSVR